MDSRNERSEEEPLGDSHPLSVESIVAEAEKRSGLSDWGDDRFMVPLRLLTRPGTAGLRLTEEGKRQLRRDLVQCLNNRLLIQDEIKRHPETTSEVISRPLFIVGLPRIGSTLLQRLLSRDPNCRPLLHWETVQPAPAPDPRTHDRDPRIQAAQDDMQAVSELFSEPTYAAMHFSDVTQPEECWLLLQNTFLVPGPFSSMTEFPEYLAWQEQQDRNEAYAYYKLQLQILQRNFPPAHWVLKGSDHLSNLDALLSTFPDACIVHLHRDPKEVIPSICNVAIKTWEMSNTLDDDFRADAPHKMMAGFRDDIARAIGARAQADPKRFFDVRYPDVVADPVGVIRGIYEYFDYSFGDAFEGRIVEWLEDNPKGKHGVHQYSLEQFGLTPNGVDTFFADYCERFGLLNGRREDGDENAG
jgi:hypothetical protein